jgi:hypothetical protein
MRGSSRGVQGNFGREAGLESAQVCEDVSSHGRGDNPGDEIACMKQQTGPLVTVIVSCFGQLEYTRYCAPSVLRQSRQPVELLFLDCDSMDGMAEYLEGFAAASAARVWGRKVSGDFYVRGQSSDLRKRRDSHETAGSTRAHSVPELHHG